MRKPAFCKCENKDADKLRGNREADQRFVFATRIVQSLLFLNPKFQASSRLQWLYRQVFVGPGRKPRGPVFSQRGSFKSSYTELRPNQGLILKQVLNGRDVLFCSQTGSGKRIIFEVAPFAFHILSHVKSC